MRRLALAALSLVACGATPAPAPRAPQPAAGCVSRPPPRPSRIKFEGPPACPAAFAACLSLGDAAALERDVRALRDWASEAWARCGAAP